MNTIKYIYEKLPTHQLVISGAQAARPISDTLHPVQSVHDTTNNCEAHPVVGSWHSPSKFLTSKSGSSSASLARWRKMSTDGDTSLRYD